MLSSILGPVFIPDFLRVVVCNAANADDDQSVTKYAAVLQAVRPQAFVEPSQASSVGHQDTLGVPTVKKLTYIRT